MNIKASKFRTITSGWRRTTIRKSKRGRTRKIKRRARTSTNCRTELALEKQLTEWFAKTSPSYSGLVSRPGILFAMKFQPPKQQPMLVTLTSADDLKSEKMVLDPNALDQKERPRSIGLRRRGTENMWRFRFPRAAAKMARCTFTKRRPGKRCRIRSLMCNIQQPAGARRGMRTAPEFITPVSAQGREAGRRPEFLSAGLFS